MDGIINGRHIYLHWQGIQSIIVPFWNINKYLSCYRSQKLWIVCAYTRFGMPDDLEDIFKNFRVLNTWKTGLFLKARVKLTYKKLEHEYRAVQSSLDLINLPTTFLFSGFFELP